MSIQQIIAFFVIAFFIMRLFRQRRDKNVNTQEFRFWLAFWALAAVAIAILPRIDTWLRQLGFSASGIQFLPYLAVAVLFYFIFRLRLRLARLEQDITKIVRAIALHKNDE